MNINRRAEFADGGIWLGRNPDGICDHELEIIKFEDLNNKLLAVLINWPCHGTTSGQDNYQITGDWPGAAARYVKKLEGNDVIVGTTEEHQQILMLFTVPEVILMRLRLSVIMPVKKPADYLSVQKQYQ